MSVLEFENQIFTDVVEDDCLVVLSKGLGIERLLTQLVRAYNDPDYLVFIIGTSADEEKFIREKLEEEDVAENRLPISITSEYGASERVKFYAKGGVYFVTSRILVVDMLVDRVPFSNVTGLIVYDAHKILEAHQDRFILRLFREKNKTGFIKALTQFPAQLTKGFSRLDRTMRALFVKKLYLWPRFHAEISGSFESRAKPDVVEVRFTLSPLMESIQFAIIDLISQCLKEMSKSNMSYLCDTEELNVENALSPFFGKYLRRLFDGVWHQLPLNTKRLINDMRLLRQVLFSLTEDDCVTFFNLVESIRCSVKLDSNVSDWYFWKPADTLFDGARQRLVPQNTTQGSAPDVEMNPKWMSFCEIVEEIKQETENLERDVSVLVILREESTAIRLRDVLDKGPRLALNELCIKSGVALAKGQKSASEVEAERRKKRLRMGSPTHAVDEDQFSCTQNIAEFIETQDILRKKREIDIHYHCTSMDSHLKLEKYLRTEKPWFVIMYDADMEVIRRLEMYQALHCSPEQMKIFFFMYDGSAEEQRYLTSLRKEKEAFECLIREKSVMVVPEERDGKCGNHPDLIRGSDLASQEQSTRRGGDITRNKVINQKVIVDMREFRSELPSIVHKRGMDIEPVTIEIGDYVLTPDTCVERKSISDLIGSLNNGRLYSQASVMTRHYKRSLLLIEFDEDKPFNLRGKLMGFTHKTISGNEFMETIPKLILLTISFPTLRVIWSPSPHFSAECFENLKLEKDQPDIQQILAVSEEQLPAERNPDRYDLQAKEFLLSLPGVNLVNVYRIMNRLKCLKDLISLSIAELSKILDSEQNAKALYEALHAQLVTSNKGDQIRLEQNVKGSKRFKRRK